MLSLLYQAMKSWEQESNKSIRLHGLCGENAAWTLFFSFKILVKQHYEMA